MSPDEIVQQTEAHVRATLAGDGSGHDWWHIERVRRNARAIARYEAVDPFVVELAALLHDIADWKFHGGDESAGPRAARQWLESLQVDEAAIGHVCEIIETLSFKGAGVPTPMSSREGAVVQDADRLDAIGALGIARAFAYGGAKHRPMHDPGQQPHMHQSFEDYKQNSGSTINHFYEKLLLLKDLMNTDTAKHMAAERHAFMEQFLEQFYAEWRGE